MAPADHSFDLLERRPGWKAEDVLVVTPYVEKQFFELLADGLRPRRLLSEYRPDPSFLRIPIHLAKGLSQTEQERLVASSGFLVPAKKRLSFPYALPESEVDGVAYDDDGDEDDEVGNWRRKFFVWTQLGEWCSDECHAAEHRHFRRKRHEEREARLQRLRTMQSPSVRQSERARFLASLTRLWADFGDEAPEMLRGGDAISEEYYIGQFEQRVERDLALAADKEFRDRYLRGYELSQVPRFRPDVRGWREFVDSFARQVCLDGARKQGQSRLPRAVLEGAELAGLDETIFDDPDKLVEKLRLIFKNGDLGDAAMARATKVISRYHRD